MLEFQFMNSFRINQPKENTNKDSKSNIISIQEKVVTHFKLMTHFKLRYQLVLDQGPV